MDRIYKLFLHAIYPSLILYFIYVISKAFVDGLAKKDICNLSGTAAIVFFGVFLVGVVGYIVESFRKN